MGTALVALTTAHVQAHPHVFAEARMEVVVGDNKAIDTLRHVWRFDELFSSTVLLEFDANSNLKLEPEELAEVGTTVHASLADFDFYTSVDHNGKAVEITAPDVIHVDFQDGQLLMFFAVAPREPLPLEGTLSFGAYDPTMYAALDFLTDDDLVVEGPATGCKHTIIRPNADEVLAQNEDKLTQAFFDDPENNDISKFFATRLELIC